jgi:hypothetical protein
LLGGLGFGHDSAMRQRCNLPAAQLMLSVRRLIDARFRCLAAVAPILAVLSFSCTSALDHRTDLHALERFERCHSATRTLSTVCPVHKRLLERLVVKVRYGLRGGLSDDPLTITWYNHWYRAVPRLFPFTILDWPEGGCIVPEKPEEVAVLACRECLNAEKAWRAKHPKPW